MPEPEAWVSTTLGECAEFLSGGTPSKGNPAFWHGTIPWVTAKDMKSFQLANTEDHVTEIGASNGTRLVPPGTVLILVRGMTLHNSIPIGVLGRQAAFNQDIKALRAREHVDDRFLAHLLMANRPVLLSMVHAAGHGTGVLATDRLKALEVELPGLEEQRAIAGVLGALDDKIEQNRRTGEALERLARATFKAWFVDFEPVRAKADGAKGFPGMPPEAFAALPTTFTPSPLGPIPEGWEVRPIGDLVSVRGGATPSTKEPAFWENGTHCWVTPKDLSGLRDPVLLNTERRITDAGAAQISSGVLPIDTVLLSSRAPIGYTALAKVPTAINQGFIALVCDGILPPLFVLHWVRFAMEEIKGRASGTTFPEISKAAFRPIDAVCPADGILRAFEDYCGPIFDLITANVRESNKLAEARDYLLPRLLSGVVRVGDTWNG